MKIYFNIMKLFGAYLLVSHAQASDTIENLKEEEQSPSISTSTSHAAADQLSPVSDQRPSISGSSNVGAEDQGTSTSLPPLVNDDDQRPFTSTPAHLSIKKPIKHFQHFNYDPNTRTFSGGFFDEANHIIGEAATGYGGKSVNIKYTLIPEMKRELEDKKRVFDADKFEQLKSEKHELKQQGKILSDENLQLYKRLKEQKGKIIRLKAKLAGEVLRAEKYNNITQSMMNLKIFLEETFYLELLAPFYINTTYPLDHPQREEGFGRLLYATTKKHPKTGKESVVFDCINLGPDDPVLIKLVGDNYKTLGDRLKEVQDHSIECDSWHQRGAYIAEIFNKYSKKQAKYNKVRASKIKKLEKKMKDYKDQKSFKGRDKGKDKVSRNLKDEVTERLKKAYTKELVAMADRYKGEIKPLVAFYHKLIKVLSDFQDELRSQDRKTLRSELL